MENHRSSHTRASKMQKCTLCEQERYERGDMKKHLMGVREGHSMSEAAAELHLQKYWRTKRKGGQRARFRL